MSRIIWVIVVVMLDVDKLTRIRFGMPVLWALLNYRSNHRTNLRSLLLRIVATHLNDTNC